MAAEPVAGVVVLARIVRLPEVDERARHRAAAAGEHHSRDRQPGAFQAGLEKRRARRRSRREEGTLGLRWRRVVVVRALRRGRQRRPLLHGVAEAELQQVSAGENEGKRDHGAEKPATGLVVGRMLVHRSLTVRVADELKERLTSELEGPFEIRWRPRRQLEAGKRATSSARRPLTASTSRCASASRLTSSPSRRAASISVVSGARSLVPACSRRRSSRIASSAATLSARFVAAVLRRTSSTSAAWPEPADGPPAPDGISDATTSISSRASAG